MNRAPLLFAVSVGCVLLAAGVTFVASGDQTEGLIGSYGPLSRSIFRDPSTGAGQAVFRAAITGDKPDLRLESDLAKQGWRTKRLSAYTFEARLAEDASRYAIVSRTKVGASVVYSRPTTMFDGLRDWLRALRDHT